MLQPGEALKNKLTEAAMSRRELSQRTGVSEKHICTVLNGERGISTGFARKLGYVFEDTSYWLQIQAEYDNEQMRIQEENAITEKEIKVLKPLHDITAYFVEKGYIHNDCGDASKVMQLRELLNVSDLLSIPQIHYNAAYRAQLSTNIKVDPYVLFAWQRLCEKETEGKETDAELNRELLEKSIPQIREAMFGKLQNGVAELQKIFAKCGIVFQVVKNFRGAPVQGFIKEISENRLILCLTLRGQRADVFWFTLFHEVAHILHGDYSVRFVDFDSVQNEMETKADMLAGDILIPPQPYREFIMSADCTKWSAIETFAKKVHVQPFIVLGRLQKDKILEWSDYPEKIKKYKWVA